MDVLRRLFGFRGEISGKAYFGWGLLLFAIKYPLDHLMATQVLGIEWHPFMYFSVHLNPLFGKAATLNLWVGMLAAALPFLAAGLSLTVQRLRTLRLSPVFSV